LDGKPEVLYIGIDYRQVHPLTSVAPLELGQLLQASTHTVREAAWEELIAQHTRLILAAARSFGGGSDEAMDRYAFILEKLRESDFRRLRTFRPDAGARFSTWLTLTARRLCLDHHRAVYGRPRGGACSSESTVLQTLRRTLLDSVGAEYTVDAIADSTLISAETRAIVSERDSILREELEKLPSRDRLLLALRFEDEMPTSRIALVLGLPNQFSVYRRLNSILSQLRAGLESRGVDAADG
jgi:RNA polymerase sigma factor (sigma-70 family)